jgi:type II secretory pathway component PulL
MSAVCRNVVSEGVQLADAYRAMLERDQEALKAVQANRTLLRRFLEFFSGAGRDRARVIDELVEEAGKAGVALKKIQSAIEFVGARPLGSRAKLL